MDWTIGACFRLWGSGSVRIILRNQVYTGCIVYGKHHNLSFKNKKAVENPKENWIVVPQMHEALISEELWQKAQGKLVKKCRTNSSGTVQIFAGKLRCSDCGNSLNFCVENREPLKGYYCCRTNKRLGKKACTRHYITYTDLYAVVLSDIQHQQSKRTSTPMSCFNRFLLKKTGRTRKNFDCFQKELSKVQRRLSELDRLFIKIYEDNALGKLDDSKFKMMEQKYKSEQNELETRVLALTEKLQIGDATYNAEQFAQSMKKYVGITALDRHIVDELIDTIVIGDKFKFQGKKTQNIDIYYKFVGWIHSK